MTPVIALDCQFGPERADAERPKKQSLSKRTGPRYDWFMRSRVRNVLFSFLFASSALAGVPAINVAVLDSSGRTAFQGATNTDGLFATAKLVPGNYVVQFDSPSATLKGSHYLIVVAAGSKKFTADAVPGGKFSGGGVAMKIAVGSPLKVTGQIVSEQPLSSNAEGNVRIIQGVRYYWVKSGTGSNLGRWVEAGTTNPRNVVGMDSSVVRNLQDRTGEGAASTMQRIPEGHGLTGH
jgi:hypothetical protein